MSDTPLNLHVCMECDTVYALQVGSWKETCRSVRGVDGNYRACNGRLTRIDLSQLLRLAITSPADT